MKTGPNLGSDTKTGLEVVRFQTDGLLESQIRLFYAIEVTLYGGFGVELGRGRGISNLDKKARITRPAPLI